MIWCFVSYVCSFHLSQKTNWQLFRLSRYGRFSIFRFFVSVILVDKQLGFYATFWSDPVFMPKLANIWQKRLPQGSIFNFRRFSLDFLSFINRSPWKLVKMCILISLTNHVIATFWYNPIYMPKQAKIFENRPLWQPFVSYICLFGHVSGVWSKSCSNMIG